MWPTWGAQYFFCHTMAPLPPRGRKNSAASGATRKRKVKKDMVVTFDENARVYHVAIVRFG